MGATDTAGRGVNLMDEGNDTRHPMEVRRRNYKPAQQGGRALRAAPVAPLLALGRMPRRENITVWTSTRNSVIRQDTIKQLSPTVVFGTSPCPARREPPVASSKPSLHEGADAQNKGTIHEEDHHRDAHRYFGSRLKRM